MSVSKAVRRIKVDIAKLQKAQGRRHDAAKELRKDQSEGKLDHRQLAKLVSKGRNEHKALNRDRNSLAKDAAARSNALEALKAKKQALVQQFPDAFTTDPLNPNASLSNPTLQAGLDEIAQQEALVHAKFDPRIDQDRGRIAEDRSNIGALRAAIAGKRKEIQHDRSALKHDRQRLDKAIGAAKNARHKALNDLRPAEYKLGLRGTNRIRKALGLKSVDHVLRPNRGKRVVGYVNGKAHTIRVSPVGNGQYLRTDAAKQYKRMLAAAARAGIQLSSSSGYRTMAQQQQLWIQFGQNPARVARPGYSNHQGGVAMDIGGVGGYGTSAYRWLSANAGRYGFRNTVAGEPWHWSYGVNG